MPPEDPMSSPAVTKEDLKEIIGELKEHLGQRIDDLTVAVRETNGRVRKLETDDAVHEQRISNIEKDREQPRVVRAASSSPTFDIRRLAVGVGAIGAMAWLVVEGLFRLGEWLQQIGIRK